MISSPPSRTVWLDPGTFCIELQLWESFEEENGCVFEVGMGAVHARTGSKDAVKSATVESSDFCNVPLPLYTAALLQVRIAVSKDRKCSILSGHTDEPFRINELI